MIKKLNKAQGKRLMQALDETEVCFKKLLLTGKKITNKDKAKFQKCMIKVLCPKPQKQART